MWYIYVPAAILLAIFLGGFTHDVIKRTKNWARVDRNVATAFWPITWVIFFIIFVAKLPRYMLGSTKPPKIIIEKGAKITDQSQCYHLKRLVEEWEKGVKRGVHR